MAKCRIRDEEIDEVISESDRMFYPATVQVI
jgi:hypothetical protein